MTPNRSKSDTIDELPDVVGMTHSELESFFSDFGKEKYRATQVMKWLHQGLTDTFDRMTNLSKTLRDEISHRARIGRPRLVAQTRSTDGTRKFLLRLRDGFSVETVLIPGEDHDTLCVSTQIGCAMGCRICRTARMGHVRDLTSAEIVSQLLEIRRLVPESRITNVVFMGMGEPLANFRETVRAVKILTHPNGPQISWRRLTVSTAGVVPRIRDLGNTLRVKLAVSLNATTDEQRTAVMPINRKYPLAMLIEALKDYPLPRRDRITIEYVLIDGFNDSDADARELVRILNPIRAKVNLIPLNGGLSLDFQKPRPERVLRFQEILMSKSLVAIIRKSRGEDILAACGQLAAGGGGECVNKRLDDLIHAMSNPTIYPHRPESVHVIQTHISVVFVAGDLVYKIKKPVDFGFLDFTTLGKRRHFCRQEVVLNSRFSEGIYLDVVPIYRKGTEVNLRGEGQEIDVAVLMRRIPEEYVLKTMLDQEQVTETIIDRVAERLAYFHSKATAGPEIAGFGSVEVLLRNLSENFDQTRRFIGLTIDGRTHKEISNRAFDYLKSNEDLLRKRSSSGFIRDCHGDLHLDHVVIINGIMLIDCIEFNDRFRFSDTAADLAFLLMDLDFWGFPAFANRLATRYAQAAGDDEILSLVGFYKSYRAYVRGKVNSFSLDEEEISESEKSLARAKAREYFLLALGSLKPPPGPLLIIMVGLSGSGKSFLSSRLSVRLGAEVFRSDVVRKQSMGIPIGQHRLDMYGQGIYTPNATQRTYRLLAEQAAGLLGRGESVILDASFIRYQDRVTVRDLARGVGARFVMIECVVPDEIARQRLEVRITKDNEPSDARWEIFKQQKAGFEAIRAEERQCTWRWDSTSNANSFLAVFVRNLIIGSGLHRDRLEYS